jgi:hypothetical protein
MAVAGTTRSRMWLKQSSVMLTPWLSDSGFLTLRTTKQPLPLRRFQRSLRARGFSRSRQWLAEGEELGSNVLHLIKIGSMRISLGNGQKTRKECYLSRLVTARAMSVDFNSEDRAANESSYRSAQFLHLFR